MKPLIETPSERLDRVTHPLDSDSVFGGIGIAIIIAAAILTILGITVSMATSGLGGYYNAVIDLAS